MSRAFVDESASESLEDDVPEIKIPLPPGARNYMTPEGAARLRQELAELVNVERPRVTALKQGAGGPLGKSLREVERRIEYLGRMVSLIEVVEPGSGTPQRVVFGVTVAVQEETGARREYRIVGVDESDPGRGTVSWMSPLARALMGKRPGDSVRAALPGGEKRLKILALS